MTPVRQPADARIGASTARSRKAKPAAAKSKAGERRGRQGVKAAPSGKQPGTRVGGGTSEVAQVRLQADEAAALRHVMHQLKLPSRSEALREAIRLLIREANEIAMAEEIRDFYGGAPAPLPDGVVAATEEELAAADAVQW